MKISAAHIFLDLKHGLEKKRKNNDNDTEYVGVWKGCWFLIKPDV